MVNRPVVLALTSFLAFLTYLFGLLLPYNLLALKLHPLLNIATLTTGNPVTQTQFVVTLALLSGLYYLAWRVCRGQQTRAMWIIVLSSALVFNLTLLYLYPIGAADIFDNILHARVTTIYGGNPFYDRPSEIAAHDPVYFYAAWRTTPSAYGPLWESLAAVGSLFAPNNLTVNVLVFKSISIIFYFGCLGLIALVLRRHDPPRALQGLVLFAFNPLVLYETAGNGHNDSVMAFFLILAMCFSIANRHTSAALAATAGALIKFIPALILPIVVVAGLRSQPTRRAQLRYLASTASICVIVVVIAYAPFWRNSDALGLQQKETMFTASLPAMLQANLESTFGIEASRRLVTNGALIATGLVVTLAVWRVWSETPPGGSSSPTLPYSAVWLVPIKASTFVLLFYLLFTCLWFQAWYALWPLALAALLPEGESGRIAVLLSYSAIWKTIIFDFFLNPGDFLTPRLWRETWLGPATLGITWLYGIYAAVRKGLSASRSWPRIQAQPANNTQDP
jgi:hypothetical protein